MLNQRDALRNIRTFPQLIKFLRDELEWPIESEDFEELTFDYTPEELGIDTASAAKIQEIKRLRPLSVGQPWGIFFVKFEPKRLPVVALRRVLSRVVLKKRASANSAERAAWQADDLLFISNYGEGTERQISFAHFSQDGKKADLPTLKVLGWDNRDTPLHMDDVAETLHQRLAWPEDDKNAKRWREQWRSAFRLRHLEVISTSKDLAVRLADLARDIRARIQTVLAIETEKGPITRLMKAFKEALIHDLSADDFADMYAQTIAYGLLSARVANPAHDTADAVATHIPVTNPFLKELMETFLHLGGRQNKERGGNGIDFDELGVSEVVELLDAANMEAVVRDFGDRNRDEDPVIHFYELFLKEYDAKKRMDRGVFYTPQAVVSYIVRSVHELLQTEFGLQEGLASTVTWSEMAAKHAGLKVPAGVKPTDPFVQILDPATGTATFLVEVIDVIHGALTAKWKQQRLTDSQERAAWNEYVPKYLLPRLHGYELLMAPYAIAHMKIGLKLYETGYRFGSGERARIYLTNALEPATPEQQMTFAQWVPALAHEAQAVNAIKHHQRFTIVIGNPPYSVKSYNNGPWIRELLEDFKKNLNETKLNLDDDFIKFLRYAAHQIETCGIGLFAMITNNIFLSGVTHRQLRRHLLLSFTAGTITNLHGDTRYGEEAPAGRKNENVFDIQQGVCISCFVRHPGSILRTIRYADIWGSRQEKTAQLSTPGAVTYMDIVPASPLYYFYPVIYAATREYQAWPLLTEWMPLFSNGIETHKDGLTIHFTKGELKETVEKLLSLPVEKARSSLDVGEDGRDWHLSSAIKSLRAMVSRGDKEIAVTYRPFDMRYTILNHESGGFIAYPRWEVMASLVRVPGNVGLVSARLMARGGVWDSCFVTRYPTEKKTGDSTRSSTLFPLFVAPNDLLRHEGVNANLSPGILKAVETMIEGPSTARASTGGPAYQLFWYIYALLYSPSYRSLYAEHLKGDFPRIPLTGSVELFRSLTRLGGDLVTLHLLESPKLEKAFTTYTGSANPDVEKVSYARDTVWLDKAQMRGFGGVPEAVWNFHIGGYQVCEKWLKDRKGRTLSKDDIAHYNKIVVALSETIRLMTEIDEVIEKHGGWPGAFQTT